MAIISPKNMFYITKTCKCFYYDLLAPSGYCMLKRTVVPCKQTCHCVGNIAPVYGPAEVEQIRFPEEGSPTAIMDKLNRGLLLQWQQNSIQVTRFCQAHVYASGGCLGSNLVQLVRGQPTKVFDFNFFLSGLAEYKLAKAPVPLYEHSRTQSPSYARCDEGLWPNPKPETIKTW